MKKTSFPVVIVALALILTTTCAQASPEDLYGQILPDFSVKTINDVTFTLSESLKTHDLVLINFWASWCGPCCMEFPSLETAWEQFGECVDVVALSVEDSDTMDLLKGFASDYGLRFSIGRDEGKMFDQINGMAIPTTLIVDQNRRVVAVETGAKNAPEEFISLFDSLLSAWPAQNHAGARCVLCFQDVYGNPVPGVTVAFCNGEYTPVETDSNGRVTFDGDPKNYHVHLIAVPDGFKMPWEELHIAGDEYDLTITLYPI